MNNKFKKKSTILLILAFITTAAIICNVMQISSKADGNSLVRDTNLSVDASGKLLIKRNTINEIPMGKENSWTIFIYMCGSDLESLYGEATLDIKEMINANISDNVNIVIQTGGSRFWRDTGINSTQIGRYIVKDNGIALIEKKNVSSMGYSETLKDYLNWGIDNYAAEHMGVVFWNHGGGSIDGVCFDEKYNQDSLKLAEIEKAFNSVSKNMTDKFEFVGFDACLMSTIETANMLAPYANYMIASEEAEPGCGWNYTPVINKIVQNPDITPLELGKVIIDSYFDVLATDSTYTEGTLSLINLNRLNKLLLIIDCSS